jgi:hypothetical protein
VLAEQTALPLPEIAVAKIAAPPVLDGKLSPGEWDGATAVTGFVQAFENKLAKAQSVAWIAYDDKYLYVAMKNSRSPKLNFLSKRGRQPDDDNIVYDPSNEIWVTPPGLPPTTYQTLFNTYPGVLDAKIIPSVGYTSRAWNGGWEFAGSETREYWIVEARAPLASFGSGAIRDGATWRGLFATDVLSDADKFRAWAPGGGFADIPRHGFWHFRGDSATFQLLDVENIFTGHFDFPMAVAAPHRAAGQVEVSLRFGGGVEAAPGDLILKQSFDLKAGERRAFSMTGDLTGLDLPKVKAIPAGFCEVTAKTTDGSTLYHQVFPFTIDGQVNAQPAQIQRSPYEGPLGVQTFYAPLSKKLIVKLDRYYMERRAQAVRGMARLIDPQTKKVVAEKAVAPFYYDYSQFPLDLSTLAVPVQTEADWEKARPVWEANEKTEKENQKRAAAGEKPLPLETLPGPQPAEYSLEVTLTDAGGKELARTATPVKLLGYQFEWLPNTIGISDKVIPPWTPLRWEDGVLSMWNKRYRLNALGLAESMENNGARQLSAPMKLMATIGGRETQVRAGAPRLEKLTDANADFSGTAKLGDIVITTKTRAEFDGFIFNEMQLTPRKPTQIERLSLEVTMPASEAPAFVTTAGGWSAYHGWTPEKWDSRETSTNALRGNFVPYIFLTDSDRGFCWFADNEEGWILDPAKPTQEVRRENGVVTLRVNFVTKAGVLRKPTTIRYGWMVTPRKPQPKNFRAYLISAFGKPHPKAVSFCWADADWAVLWPYYSSPYPWDYAKSKQAIDNSLARGVTPMVGNIAHALARYRDYKGRWFNELAADWGEEPGNLANGNVARSRGPNDFQLWHWNQWIKESNLTGLYFDESYLSFDRNYLTGGAYLLPDGQIQPGYNYLGLREMYKRLRYIFYENHKPAPNLWLHTTSGQAVYAWMPDISMEAENVEPAGGQNDYMEALPASRLRSIGMGRNLGSAPFVMAQASRHWNPRTSPFLVPQLVGWVLAHDCLPEQVEFWPVLMGEMEMWREDTTFLPYWKSGLGIASSTPDVVVSAHARPGHTVLWIVNTARTDRRAVLHLDLAKIGLDPARPVVAFDAETGERYAVKHGVLQVTVPARFWRAVRLMQPKRLHGDETFTASFDHEIAADEAFGDRYPHTQDVLAASAEGKSGKGVALDKPLAFWTRHNLSRESGAVAFALRCDPTTVSGTLLQIESVKVLWSKSGLVVSEGKRNTGAASLSLPAGVAWHEVAISWRGRDLQVKLDGQQALAAKLQAPMPIPPMARGLEILSNRGAKPHPAAITFGPLQGAVMDDLQMSIPR